MNIHFCVSVKIYVVKSYEDSHTTKLNVRKNNISLVHWKWKHVHLYNHIYIHFLHVEVGGMISVSLVFLITVRKVNLKQSIDEETSWLSAKCYKLMKKYLCNKKVSLAKLIPLNNTKLCKKVLFGGNQNKSAWEKSK